MELPGSGPSVLAKLEGMKVSTMKNFKSSVNLTQISEGITKPVPLQFSPEIQKSIQTIANTSSIVEFGEV